MTDKVTQAARGYTSSNNNAAISGKDRDLMILLNALTPCQNHVRKWSSIFSWNWSEISFKLTKKQFFKIQTL